jgi:hypothetical protein
MLVFIKMVVGREMITGELAPGFVFRRDTVTFSAFEPLL